LTLNGAALQKEVIVKSCTGSTFVACFWDLKKHLDMPNVIDTIESCSRPLYEQDKLVTHTCM